MLRPWSASFITKKKSYTPVIDAIIAHCKTVTCRYLWLRIIQKALMLTLHSNTDTPGTVICLPVAAVRSARAGGARECRSAVANTASPTVLGLDCLKLSAGASFFSGYAFGYGPKTTGATLRTVSDLG